MGSNRFYLMLVLHVVLIFMGAFACFYFYVAREQPNTAVAFGVLSFLVMLRLIHHVNRTNRLLGNFLIYMHERDPSLSFTVPKAEKRFRGLQEAMERLIREFKENRIALEVQAQYLNAILENVSTGIICYNEEDEILVINRAAGTWLGVENPASIKELEATAEEVVSRMRTLNPRTSARVSFSDGGKTTHLLLQASQIKLKDQLVHILALNDISLELEEQEILSWKKLIRVINHEVMNSITPIITLARAIVRKPGKDAVKSASIIEERSQGLVSFINRYKQLTTLPQVNPTIFAASDLMARIEHLFRADLEARSVRLILPSKCTVNLEADGPMLEQALINLVKNAMEALEGIESPEIELACWQETGQRPCLSVRDNGKGIPHENLEQVFVPFYTTREGGSGIGLNLCRQIMREHDGHLLLDSTPGKGTLVTLAF